MNYYYNTQGLTTEVHKAARPVIKMFYNERGQRIKKESYNTSGLYTLQSTTYYALDISGNTMAVYTKAVAGPITQNELPIYGLSRLGVFIKTTLPANNYTNYQITDHLGNVRAIIKKIASSPIAVVYTYADYYPFGEKLPTRNNITGNYRYAYQGQELDGETGMEAFQLRLWDGRLGRWLSPDPYGQFASPYLGMGNNPVGMIDPDGGLAGDSPGPGKGFWGWLSGLFTAEKTYAGNNGLPLQEVYISATRTKTAGAEPLPSPGFPWEVIRGGASQTVARLSLTAAGSVVGVSLMLTGDTDPRGKRPDRDLIFRYMKSDGEGRPVVGQKFGELGVRLRDMMITDPSAMVGGGLHLFGNTPGMSINRTPTLFPKMTTYAIHPRQLPPGLKYS